MNWIFRILQQILVLVCIKLPVQLIGIPIVALELLFHLKDKRLNNCLDQRLFFKWFDNGDDRDRKYGLNGDLGYQASTHNLSIDSYKKLLKSGARLTKWHLYKMRFIWLALRNPINYFQYRVLGVKSSRINKAIYYDDIPTQENEIGDWHKPGIRQREVTDTSGHIFAWEYYIVYQYPFKKDKCFRARIGHKLGHRPKDEAVGRDYIQWVCSIQPWKSYKGK